MSAADLNADDELVIVRIAPTAGRHLADVEQDLAAHMAAGINRARGHLLAGRPGRALYELTRSLERQARVAGLGSIPITSAPCPCGGGEACPRDYRHQVRHLHGEAAR